MGALLQVSDVAVSFDNLPRSTASSWRSTKERSASSWGSTGRATLIDVITGLTAQSTGSVVFDGRELLGRREHEIVGCGVGPTFLLRRFARRVTVMHEGKVVSEGSVDQVRADPLVQEVYLGRSRDRRGHRVVEPVAGAGAAPTTPVVPG